MGVRVRGRVRVRVRDGVRGGGKVRVRVRCLMKYLGADGGAPGWVLAKVEAKARDHTTCSAHVTWAGLGFRGRGRVRVSLRPAPPTSPGQG